jgi:hypothetical protein
MGSEVIANRTKLGSVLRIWTPEDKAFWEQEGRAIANIFPGAVAACRRAKKPTSPCNA